MHQPASLPAAGSKFANIDLIRFVAAMVVFLSHISAFLHIGAVHRFEVSKQHSILVSLSEAAFCGPAAVMLFFIVSGICIHAPHRFSHRIPLGEFYVRRFVRIGVPALAACLVLVLLTGSSDLSALPLWSLICEAIYYLLYPALVCAIAYCGFLPVFLATLLASICLGMVPDDKQGQVSTYGPLLTWILYLPVWLMGVWIAERSEAVRRWPAFVTSPRFAAAASVGMFALGTLAVSSQFHIPGGPQYKLSMVLLAFPGALFVALLLHVDLTEQKLLRFLDRQGAWSYSLYLVHPLAALACAGILYAGGVVSLGQSQSLLVYALLVVGGLLAARLFYGVIERPSHRLARVLGTRFRRANAMTVTFATITLLPKRALKAAD